MYVQYVYYRDETKQRLSEKKKGGGWKGEVKKTGGKSLGASLLSFASRSHHLRQAALRAGETREIQSPLALD